MPIPFPYFWPLHCTSLKEPPSWQNRGSSRPLNTVLHSKDKLYKRFLKQRMFIYSRFLKAVCLRGWVYHEIGHRDTCVEIIENFESLGKFQNVSVWEIWNIFFIQILLLHLFIIMYFMYLKNYLLEQFLYYIIEYRYTF